MENPSDQIEPTGINFDSVCIDNLRRTRKWTKFLSLLGLFMLVIMLIIFLITTIPSLMSNGKYLSLSILPMLLIAVIYFFPLYYLFQFSRYSKLAITHHDTKNLSISIKYLRMHYTFLGILVIIMMLLYSAIAVALIISGKNFFHF